MRNTTQTLKDRQFQRLADKVREAKDRSHYDGMKKKLEGMVERKCNTITIGILQILETEMGFLWGHDDQELTDEQLEMQEVWASVRVKILDQGCTQKRALINNVGQAIRMPPSQVIYLQTGDEK